VVNRDDVRTIVHRFARDTWIRNPLELKWTDGDEGLSVRESKGVLVVRCNPSALEEEADESWGTLEEFLPGQDESDFGKNLVVNALARGVAELLCPQASEEYGVVLACMAGAFPFRPHGDDARDLWTAVTTSTDKLEALKVALVPPFRLDVLDTTRFWVLSAELPHKKEPVLVRFGRHRDRSVPLAIASVQEVLSKRFGDISDEDATLLGFEGRESLDAYLEEGRTLYLRAEQVHLWHIAVDRPIMRWRPDLTTS
jgi:hypothetical protein